MKAQGTACQLETPLIVAEEHRAGCPVSYQIIVIVVNSESSFISYLLQVSATTRG
jgi:hypothetical protein